MMIGENGVQPLAVSLQHTLRGEDVNVNWTINSFDILKIVDCQYFKSPLHCFQANSASCANESNSLNLIFISRAVGERTLDNLNT